MSILINLTHKNPPTQFDIVLTDFVICDIILSSTIIRFAVGGFHMAKRTKTRRANGEGTIRQRSDGRWEGRYQDPITGKRTSIYGKTRQEIRVQITKIQREIDLNQYLPKSDLTFDELITQYFEDYKKYRVKPQTMYGYRQRYKNIFKPYIGDVPIQNITEDMLYGVINSTADSGKSKSYIKSACVTIKETLEFAVKKKLILENPMRYVNGNIGRSEGIKRELSSTELHWFFKGVNERYGQVSLLFELLLYTGMRVSELCSLRWKDIEEDFRFLHVENSLTRYQDETGKYIQCFTSPKTKSSRRCIPVIEHLQDKIRNFKDECAVRATQFGVKMTDDSLVFIPDIKDPEIPYDRGRISNIIRTTIRYVKNTYNYSIEDFTPHYFRHKFISVAIREKMPIKDLMTIVGHVEVNTLLKTYTHTADEYLMASINALPNMYA